MSNSAALEDHKWQQQAELSELLTQMFLYLTGMAILVLALILIVVYLVLLASPLLVERYSQYIPIIQQHRKMALLAFVLLAIGLYQLRTRALPAYAIIEISSGIALGWNALINTYPQGLLFWGAFMGAVYLLVRGFDNFRISKASNWDKVGTSTVSVDDAINDATERLIRNDLHRYNSKPSAKTFYETVAVEVIDTSVKLEKSLAYQVRVKAKRVRRRRDREYDRKYSSRTSLEAVGSSNQNRG